MKRANAKQITPYRYSWWHFLAPLGLVLVTVLCYLPSMHYAFQFDDIANITKHFNIRHYTLRDLFFNGSRWISYWLNAMHYSIGKFDPFCYRVGNLIIHNINGLLVFYLFFTCLSRLKRPSFFKENALFIALATSTLFLLHPVQTQTVSYVIQGELEGLAALLSLSTIACFLNLCAARSFGTNVLYTLLVFSLAAFACGTKEITIVLPFLLLYIDWFFVAQASTQEIAKRWWLHMAVVCIMGSLYLYLLKPHFFYDLFGLRMMVKNNIGNIITQNPHAPITPLIFFLSQFKVILHYIVIFLWPFNISVEYDWMLTKGFFAPDCLVPFTLLLAIAFGTLWLLRRTRTNPLCFGILWFFTGIIPRSSIIPSPELIADYKTYLASIGWLFIIASALVYVCTRIATRIPVLQKNAAYLQFPLLFICAAILGYQAHERNKVWSSGLAFWGNVIENAPNKARAYNNYGVELSQGLARYTDSIPYFQKAISMDAQYPDPCNNLAVAYARTNNLDGAIAAMIQGLKINAHYPEGHNNLASFFLQKGDADNAQHHLQQALLLRPHYGKAYFNLGRAYGLRGDLSKAWECYKKACLEADFDTETGFSVYAQASLALQKYDEAIVGFKKTLELNPRNISAMFALGNALYFSKNYQEALIWYKKTIEHTPDDVRVLFNIGETYMQLKNPRQALGYFEQVPRSKMPQVTASLAYCHRALGTHDKRIAA